MPCERCEPYGGLWMETANGLRRCACATGRRLAEGPVANEPTISGPEATAFVEMLASIPFFPPENGARLAIGDEIRSMCAGSREALWLVTRMRRLYTRWPGPSELRRVYASKHLPWDGVQPIGISESYPEGIPSEREQLIAPQSRQITDGKVKKAVESMAAKMPRMVQ